MQFSCGCSAGSGGPVGRYRQEFRAPWCACYGLPTVGRMDGWVGERTIARRSWRLSPGRTWVQIQCQETSCYTGYFSGTARLYLGGKTLLLPSSVDISHQLHALTTVVLMCPDSSSGGNKQLKHLLLHCPEHSFGVAVKINYLRRKEGKGINLQ